MNYRMLMNFGMLLFAVLTLQCSNPASQREDITGAWVGSHHAVKMFVSVDTSGHYADTMYDTGFSVKTFSIEYNTITISRADSGFRIIHPTPYTPPLTGAWSLIGDYLIVYPYNSEFVCYSTRYIITKHLPGSLIFSSSDGIDTCQKQ